MIKITISTLGGIEDTIVTLLYSLLNSSGRNPSLIYIPHPQYLITSISKTGFPMYSKQPTVQFAVTQKPKFGNEDEDSIPFSIDLL